MIHSAAMILLTIHQRGMSQHHFAICSDEQHHDIPLFVCVGVCDRSTRMVYYDSYHSFCYNRDRECVWRGRNWWCDAMLFFSVHEVSFSAVKECAGCRLPVLSSSILLPSMDLWYELSTVLRNTHNLSPTGEGCCKASSYWVDQWDY